jgi:hypothetical protein
MRDYRTAAELFTPQTQDMLSASMIYNAPSLAAFNESKANTMRQLLEKHNLGPDIVEGALAKATSKEETLTALAALVEDKPAFIADMLVWMDENTDQEPTSAIPLGPLGDVAIKGDTATATRLSQGQSKPIEFRRSNGTWLIHMTMK